MEISANQFGGQHGEPDPDMFNNDADYLSAHKSWKRSTASGKAYKDPDVAKLVRHTKEQGRAQAAPLRQAHQHHQAVRSTAFKALRSLGRIGSTPKGYRAPKAGHIAGYRKAKRNPFS